MTLSIYSQIYTYSNTYVLTLFPIGYEGDGVIDTGFRHYAGTADRGRRPGSRSGTVDGDCEINKCSETGPRFEAQSFPSGQGDLLHLYASLQ